MDTFVGILGNFFVQIVFLFGFIILYGLVICLCNKLFYDALGDAAFTVVWLTGFIGTPVHELSHALMCLLFGHKITKMRIFNLNRRSHTLGFVEHSYYRKNVYHQLGNFFIGISPVLAGGALILLLVRLLVPELFFTMAGERETILLAARDGLSSDFLRSVPDAVGQMYGVLFAAQNFRKVGFWVCLGFVFIIALHMEISRSDVVSGARGLGVIAVLFLLVDIFLGLLFPGAFTSLTVFCVSAGAYISLLLSVPALFSLLIGFLSLLVISFRIMFGKKTLGENARG